MTTTPTPGALRAAKQVCFNWIVRYEDESKVVSYPTKLEEMAAIIDSQTGLPELVEALEDAATWAEGRAPQAVVARYRAALAKARGPV